MKMKLHPDIALILKTAKECHALIEGKGLCHVIMGGLAVYLHGYVDRETRDIDLLIRPEDKDKIKATLGLQYKLKKPWNSYLSSYNIRIDYHWNGKETKNGTLQLPDPAIIEIDNIDGLPVAALTPLIEMKLECEIRRQLGQTCDKKHRDDVLGLIQCKHLDESYADRLAQPVRELFRQLVNEASI